MSVVLVLLLLLSLSSMAFGAYQFSAATRCSTSASKNAYKVRESGLELYKRPSVMHGHFTKLGDTLEKAVFAYNDTIGSLEKNVLPQARRFQKLRPASVNGSLEGKEVEAAPRRLDPSKWMTRK